MSIIAFLSKDQELEEALLRESIPLSSVLISFLDNLRVNIGLTKDLDTFEQLIKLFRKWKMSLFVFYNHVYPYDLRFKPGQFSESTAIDITEKLPKPKKRYSEPQDLKELLYAATSSINPYFGFTHKEIQQLDPNFYKKYVCIEIYGRAERLFKSSHLQGATDEYRSIILLLSSEVRLDGFQMYLCGAALHGLGKTALLEGRLNDAEEYFNQSLNIKKSLNELPQINLLATEVKYAITQSLFKNTTNSIEKLHDLLSRLIEQQAESLMKDNPKWFHNIKVDLLYNLSRSYLFRNDRDKSYEFANEALAEARRVRDAIGALKSYTVIGMVYPKDRRRYIGVKPLVSSLSPERKQNPYLRVLTSKRTLTEISLFNPSFSEELVRLFSLYRIKPLN